MWCFDLRSCLAILWLLAIWFGLFAFLILVAGVASGSDWYRLGLIFCDFGLVMFVCALLRVLGFVDLFWCIVFCCCFVLGVFVSGGDCLFDLWWGGTFVGWFDFGFWWL